MAILNRMKVAHARNAKCKCGSGLKFKNCHGNQEFMQKANVVANLAMSVMIHHKRYKSGMITEDECDEKVGRFQELIYNVLDPDFKPVEQSKELAVQEVINYAEQSR